MWSAEQTRETARRRLVREAEREQELVARRAAAREHAEELARTIAKQDSNVTRIVGFGSTFDERLPFTYFSDIDLAVAGGTIIGWKIAEQSPWKVDFVELEHQEQTMVDAILASGVVLYERS
jgi:predicted nucleotidyltransferase